MYWMALYGANVFSSIYLLASLPVTQIIPIYGIDLSDSEMNSTHQYFDSYFLYLVRYKTGAATISIANNGHRSKDARNSIDAKKKTKTIMVYRSVVISLRY